MYRVQMVSKGIPAYQSDFATEAYAVKVAGELASGGDGAEKVHQEGEAVRYKIKDGYVRAFALNIGSVNA